jgi:uncharacterized membrane protein YqjE
MDIALSLVMLTVIALIGGAVFLFRKGLRRQAILMLVLAAVMAFNVAIWTVPTKSGSALVSTAPSGLAR